MYRDWRRESHTIELGTDSPTAFRAIGSHEESKRSAYDMTPPSNNNIDTLTPASWQSGHSTQRARQMNQIDCPLKTDFMAIQEAQQELNSEIQRRRILKCSRLTNNTTQKSSSEQQSNTLMEPAPVEQKPSSSPNIDDDSTNLAEKSQMTSLSRQLLQHAFPVR